jgi:hypothetical protein
MPLDVPKSLECSRAGLLSEMSTDHKNTTSPLKLCPDGCNLETRFCSLLQTRVFVHRHPQLVHPQEVCQKELTSIPIASEAQVTGQTLRVTPCERSLAQHTEINTRRQRERGERERTCQQVSESKLRNLLLLPPSKHSLLSMLIFREKH